MSGADLALSMVAQLKAALHCFDASIAEDDQLADAARQDRAGFTRLFSDQMETLERLCCERDQAPIFSHLAGGMLIRAIINCPDLLTVLDRSCQFSAMIAGNERRSRLTIEGDHVRFEIVSRYSTRDDAALLSDLAGLHYHLALLAWLSGQPVTPQAVTLAYPAPQRQNPVLGLFRGTIQFDSLRNGLLFEKAALTKPVIRGHAEIDEIIDGFPYNLILNTIGRQGVAAQVTLLMDGALRQGRPLPSETGIARALGMSSATLRRHLGHQQTNYRQLRASSLRTAAERMMRDRDVPLSSIAPRLGFSDDRAFRRAFRAWTGIAPSAFPSRAAKA